MRRRGVSPGGCAARLRGRGLGVGLLRFGFLLRDFALCVRLLLLRRALFLELVVAGERAGGFLDLALHTFDDAFHAGFGSRVLGLIGHCVPSAGRRVFVATLFFPW